MLFQIYNFIKIKVNESKKTDPPDAETENAMSTATDDTHTKDMNVQTSLTESSNPNSASSSSLHPFTNTTSTTTAGEKSTSITQESKSSNHNNINNNPHFEVTDDARYMWTVEEDLRLLEAISTFGLGNWADIAEEISTNKTPKRCMERYIDDFLGRYGHILPEYTMVQVQPQSDDNNIQSQNIGQDVSISTASMENQESVIGDSSRKRSRPGNDQMDITQPMSIGFRSNNKEYSIVKTSSLPSYDKLWPNPYLPPFPNIKVGDDVGRDLAVRSEQAYVKASTSASNDEEAESIRKEWLEVLNKPGGPTVLPPRAEDIKKLPGAEMAGYMPRRGDFDLEWENDADKLLEDMEFSPNDSAEDRAIKIRVIEIYNSKLDEREKRKQFLIDHDLLDYRKKQREDRKLPADERDLVNRMRLFARFQSAEEHQKLIDDLLKAKRLRKEIARLQMYQRMGFTSMLDVERFELDRNRRETHRIACRLKEKEEEEEKQAAAKAAGELTASGSGGIANDKETYHKQYKNSDRKNRKSINRSQNDSTGALLDGIEPSASNEVKDEATNINSSDVKMESNDDIPQYKDINPSSVTQTKDSGTDDKEESSSLSGQTAEPTSDSTNGDKFDVKQHEGYELLTIKEIGLCQRLELKPKLYLEAKKTLIHDSLSQGILDDTTKSSKRSIVKIDLESKDDVVKFILKSGWISAAPKVTEN